MPKIKLNFGRLSIPEKIARARQLVAALTGNANFNAPQPPLSEVTTTINELEAAANAMQAARQEVKRRKTVQDDAEGLLDRIVTQLAAYVESVAGDDEQRILSSGFEVRASNAPTGAALNAPETLNATDGDQEGEVDLSWDSVGGARSYVVERSTDPQASNAWAHAGVAPRSTFTVEGLETGTRYYFRVAAIGPNGQSPWSNLASKVAP